MLEREYEIKCEKCFFSTHNKKKHPLSKVYIPICLTTFILRYLCFCESKNDKFQKRKIMKAFSNAVSLNEPHRKVQPYRKVQ